MGVAKIRSSIPNFDYIFFIYFMDTGLVCHLTRWNTPDQLRNGAVAGHVFETFVVSEVLKSFMNAGRSLRDVWFYRDSKKREIDLVI